MYCFYSYSMSLAYIWRTPRSFVRIRFTTHFTFVWAFDLLLVNALLSRWLIVSQTLRAFCSSALLLSDCVWFGCWFTLHYVIYSPQRCYCWLLLLSDYRCWLLRQRLIITSFAAVFPFVLLLLICYYCRALCCCLPCFVMHIYTPFTTFMPVTLWTLLIPHIGLRWMHEFLTTLLLFHFSWFTLFPDLVTLPRLIRCNDYSRI